MAKRSPRSDKKPVEQGTLSVGQAADAWPAVRLPAGLRLLISAAILYHLAAVFLGAWIGSPPTSPFAESLARPFRAYIAAVDLNHGYRFFAPNPGPSHIFRYRLTFDDGSTQEAHFPNRGEHWPRLIYHRYFMLSENLNVLRPNVREPAEQTREHMEAMQRFAALARSYASHLLRSHAAEQIDWEFVRHYQPSPAEIREGRSLDDDEFYETLERGTLVREELE
jgi:hypothetical protein